MSGIILTFCFGVIVGLVFARIKEEMAARKILRFEYAGLLRLTAE
jgi:hypothetical protein